MCNLRFGHGLRVPLKKYNLRLRYDRKHNFLYCENFKIASTTWAMHLLRLKHKRAVDKSGNPIATLHKASRNVYPKLVGRKRLNFLAKNPTSFIIVRDPFERLVSAYKDKMTVAYNRKMKAWRTFGLTQLLIRRKYRKTPRPGIIPTFKEFVQYLVGELSPSPNSMKKRKPNSIDNHWTPVWLNCSPCSEKYDVIVKMETIDRDTWYLKQLLNLKEVQADYVGRGGKEGHTTGDKTLKEFQGLSQRLVKRLYGIYKYDFLLFGYSPDKYLKINNTVNKS